MPQAFSCFVINPTASDARLVGVPLRQVRREQIQEVRGAYPVRKLDQLRYGVHRSMQLLVQRVPHKRLPGELLGRRNVSGEIPVLRSALHT